MSMHCLNCGAKVNDKFCPHCGQKASVKKLTWKSLAEEIFHFITHLEKGFLATTGQLIIRPGRLCKNYLDGQRKKYHKPIGFLIIWITIFLLLFNLANNITHYERHTSGLFTNDPQSSSVVNHYRSLVEVLILPFTAFFSWLIVARRKLNYVEVLSIGFYTIAFLFIFLTAQFIAALLFGINYKTDTFDLTTMGVFVAWIFYASYDIYRRYSIRYLVPKLLLSLTVNFCVYVSLTKLIAWLISKLSG